MSKTVGQRSMDCLRAATLLLWGSVAVFVCMARGMAVQTGADREFNPGAAGFGGAAGASELFLVPVDGGQFGCPPWSQVSQVPPPPPFFDAATSDAAAQFLVFDDFGVAREICGITFWGFTVPAGGAPLECTEEPMSFRITFNQDAGGVPGAVVWSDTLDLERTPTGVFYTVFGNTIELLQYSTELLPCCFAPAGWVSVEGTSVGSEGDCWFMWMSSEAGNGHAWQEYPSGSFYQLSDRAFCLVGAPMGACCVEGAPYCIVETETYCAAADGIYLGDATECDAADCNSNGIPDCCDIASGFSDDSDGDGLPNECAGKVLLAPDMQYHPPGNPVVVTVGLSGADSVVVGGQFFLEYDPDKLAFVSANPSDVNRSDPDNPFEREIYEVVDEDAGTIDYAVGNYDGVPGTAEDVIMAVITFNAMVEECDAANLFAFRAHLPPTRLSDAFGNAVYPALLDLGVIGIDWTPPVIEECAGPAMSYVDVGVQVHMPDFTPDVTASDNCDDKPTISQTPAAGARMTFGSHVVTLEAKDDAGLTASCQTSFTVEGTGPPRLSLDRDEDCYHAGEPVRVEVWMVNIEETIVGGQFFLQYDETKLQLCQTPQGDGVVPGGTPFGVQIYECSMDEAAQAGCIPTEGLVSYAVGVSDGDPGVSGTARLATLTFIATAEITDAAGLVAFQMHDPPTRLADAVANPVNPMLVDLDVFSDDEDEDGVADCLDLCPDTLPGTDVNADGCPDCNANGLYDLCDLDCGEPGGACDVPGCGSSADCNVNQSPDDCDIADGTSLDCNATSVPDECEVLGSGDFNGDGVVDLDDFAGFVGCMAGPATPPASSVPECADACLAAFDANVDGSVDLQDFAVLERMLAP